MRCYRASVPNAIDLDAIVRCPRCKGLLARRDAAYACEKCRLIYPVLDGIASLIANDALPMIDDQTPPQKS